MVVPVSDKPWLDQREGETEDQYNARLANTCYTCGGFFVITAILVAHEEQCRGESDDPDMWRFNE